MPPVSGESIGSDKPIAIALEGSSASSTTPDQAEIDGNIENSTIVAKPVDLTKYPTSIAYIMGNETCERYVAITTTGNYCCWCCWIIARARLMHPSVPAVHTVTLSH